MPYNSSAFLKFYPAIICSQDDGPTISIIHIAKSTVVVFGMDVSLTKNFIALIEELYCFPYIARKPITYRGAGLFLTASLLENWKQGMECVTFLNLKIWFQKH